MLSGSAFLLLPPPFFLCVIPFNNFDGVVMDAVDAPAFSEKINRPSFCGRMKLGFGFLSRDLEKFRKRNPRSI